jgi:thiol-disulfide isomerase/thioredoxin
MDCTSVILIMALAAGSGQAASSELKKTPVQPAPADSRASVEITLTPVVGGGKNAIQWSPYGQRCPLTETALGLETKIALGPKDAPPITVTLTKTQGSQYYTMISIDYDRNGIIAGNERFTTKPTLSRGKWWSSFETVVPVPATDPKTGKEVSNPYKLKLWYVEEPEAGAEKILRFSRDWWLEGQATIDGVRAYVLISENVMDGVIDAKDRWALSSVAERKQLYLGDSARPITDFAWLGEKAYHIRTVHPSGRQIVMEGYDPGITRKDDAEKRDPYAADRKAARSGTKVPFLTDFATAQGNARREKKNLLVKFEATWCGPCKVMDELVFTADEVVAAAGQTVCVRIDGDQQPELKKHFKANGYPTIILLSPEGKELKRASYLGVREMKEFLSASPR